MIKNMRIGGVDVELSNNIAWAMIYRDQFGSDIVSTLMPLISGLISAANGIASEVGTDEVTADAIIKLAGTDALNDAIIQLSMLELNDFIRIVWAMAKCADDSVPEPKKWVRQFETFELDEIVPAAASLILNGVVSSKNLERLQKMKVLRPKE